jgi:hypothetical protein
MRPCPHARSRPQRHTADGARARRASQTPARFLRSPATGPSNRRLLNTSHDARGGAVVASVCVRRARTWTRSGADGDRLVREPRRSFERAASSAVGIPIGAPRDSRGWAALGTVEDPQHQHDGPSDPVHHDVWRSDDHQLGDLLELRDQVARGLRGATRSSRETPGRLPFKGRALLPAGAHRLVSQTSQGRVVGFAECVLDLTAEPAVVLPELTVVVHGVLHEHTQQLSCCPLLGRCHLGEGYVLTRTEGAEEDGSRLARETKRRRPTCDLLRSHAI